MQIIRNSVIFFLGVISLVTTSLVAQQTIGVGKQALSRLSIKHREHKGVGYDQGYSTASLFISPRLRDIGLPFLDARLHVFNNSDLASNIGIGTRYSDTKETYLFGLNAYYDYRNTRSLISHQVSGGFEILSRRVDVRLNGYYPFSGKYQDDPILFSHFRGHNLLVKQKVRYALPCADAEISFTLPDPFDQIGLYLGLGYYYLFKQEGFNKDAGNVSGGKAKLTANPTDYISFGAEYTYDKLFGSRANGFIAFNIPLGAVSSYKKKGTHTKPAWIQLKTQDVVRNEIIPILRKKHRFPHLNAEGDPLHFVFVDNKKLSSDGIGSGAGTFENPYTTLSLGSDQATNSDVVYVCFGDGTSRGYDTGFDFKPKQILTSSGVGLTLNGIVIPALEPDQLPFITNCEGPVIAASYVRQATVNGFRIEAVAGDAIQVEGTALTLKNSSVVAAPNFNALKTIEAVGISTISDNAFYGSGGPAVIVIEDARGVHKIEYNNILAQDGQNGIHIESPDQPTYITNNTLGSTDPSGIAINYQILNGRSVHECSHNTLLQGFYEAVHIKGDSEQETRFQIENNRFFSQTLVSGISYDSHSLKGILSITNNRILASAAGIAISDHTTAKSEINISDNKLFSYSGSPVIISDISGSAAINIKNNTMKYAKNLSGSFSAISCDFKSLDAQESSIVISNNTMDMNSKNEGISLKNKNQSILHATIEGNIINSSVSDKGISVINNSADNLYLNITDNKEVSGFILENKGSGLIEITAAESTIKESNNPEASYTFEGIFLVEEVLEEADLYEE